MLYFGFLLGIFVALVTIVVWLYKEGIFDDEDFFNEDDFFN